MGKETRFLVKNKKKNTNNNKIKENYIYKNTGKTLSSDIDFLLNMYCRGSVDMTVEWVLNDIPIKK